MAYIGKDPAQFKRALHEKDTFTGDGSTVVFDLTSDASSANEIQVFVDNIRQEPGASDAYTLGEDGSGNLRRITFTAAPDNGAEIYVLNPKTIDSNLIVPSDNSVTAAKIATGAVTSAKILDGTIVNADINACAAIVDTKLAQITTASKVATSAISQPGSSSVYLAGDGSWGAIDTSQQDTNAFNISLLGFKMAVNEGLTVFNLVDGVVDEFNDESGTDESEGSNDLYCGTSDYYINSSTPDGSPTSISYTAGFSSIAITEPDTSTAGTNPAYGVGTHGSFTVPSGLTSITAYTWGAGGGGDRPGYPNVYGGGGGFASGVLGISPGQTLTIAVGEGGANQGSPGQGGAFSGDNPLDSGEPVGTRTGGGEGGGGAADGGGLTGVFTGAIDQANDCRAMVIAGAGGGGGADGPAIGDEGGPGGGLSAAAGGQSTAQTNYTPTGAGGGSQTQGGQGNGGANGGKFYGGGQYGSDGGGGGAGWFGGGGGTGTPGHQAGGGGSSYYGHPQVTCGSTTAGVWSPNARGQSGGTASPYWPTISPFGYNPAGPTTVGDGGDSNSPGSVVNHERAGNGYILLVGCSSVTATTSSTTIVSTAFTSSSVATTARIVVFEEDVATPTLNTDIIASISRDGGTTFTNATLTDSGYVTGSSGQRILTGQATISGQPSGQSMRWKLALANNTVKIHGVSLQWA